MAYLTGAGLTMPRQADFITEVRREYKARTGQDLDVEYDSVLGSLVSVVTLQLDQVAEAVQGTYDSTDENNATGGQLDSIAAITGLARLTAQPSTAVVTCTGTPGSVIPAGAVVEGGGVTGASRWTLDLAVTIAASGTVDASVTCEETGPTVATAGLISTITTPIAGWDSVTNAIEATPGRDIETDGELRIRRRESLAISGQSTLGSLRAAVLALPFLTDAAFAENATPSPIAYSGITLPAHSVAIVVQPNPLTTTQVEVLASTIYARLPFGIRAYGIDIDTTVQGADGLPKAIQASYPVELQAAVTIGMRTADGFTFADIEQQVIAAVTAYFDGLGIADPARRTSSSGLVSAIYAAVDQGSIEILETPLLNGSDADIEPGPLQVVTLLSVAVTSV